MLCLLSSTDPRWVDTARGALDQLLSDHAHCELKAAQSALSLVGRFAGEAPELVAPMVALAHEETTHFELVEKKLAARDARLGPPSSDAYVRDLQAAARSDHGREPLLLDRLLVAALIEARSCERFRLLSRSLGDVEMEAFYHELMASEARHYSLFVRLAENRFGEDHARRRLAELARREADIVATLPLGPTMHG